jgi:phage terminase large subunit-like protein
MSRRTRRATRRGSRRRPVAWLPERSPDKDTLAHFERFCYSLRLPDDGGRFRLEDWQLAILEDYFAGVMESLWLLPTGQGKSTLLGALALHHGTYVRRNPRVFILGGLGGHGRNTLDAASAFIEESHDLSRWWVPQEYRMGRIKSLIDRQGEILVSSAGRRAGGRGGSAQEGSAPTLVLVEELHRHEDNGAAVRTLTSKIGKKSKGRHRVRIVHVTTAGDHFDSVLGRLVERATDVEAGCKVETSRRKREHYRYARDADGDLVMHEWAVPDQITPPAKGSGKKALDTYLRQIKRANPASFVTITDLRRAYKAASAEPWVFLRQNANQWVTQDFAAIDKVGWLAGDCGEKLQIPADVTGVYVGLDTASKWATTAITPVWVDPKTKRPRCCGAVILKSTHRGAQRRLRDAIDVLEVMRARWPRMTVVFDRNYGGGLIAEQLEEDHGLTVVDHGQGLEFDLASMLFGELVDQHGFDHDGNKDLTEQVLAAVARRSRYGRRWRIDQPRDGRPIDAADAVVMATNIALNPPDEPPEIDVDDYRITRL